MAQFRNMRELKLALFIAINFGLGLYHASQYAMCLTTPVMAGFRNMRELKLALFIAINIGLALYHAAQYVTCEEPEMNTIAIILMWMKMTEVENQCPTMDMAAWGYIITVLKEVLIIVSLALFQSAIPRISKVARAMASKFRHKSAKEGQKLTNVRYYFCKNAYATRGEIMVRRTSDEDVAIFKMDKGTRRFRRLIHYPPSLVR